MINLYSGDYKSYLIIPVVLFVLFIVAIAVYPGVTQGIDLKGGTSIIVRADTPMDSALLEQALSAKYPLSELQVGSISSPNGYGLFVQYGDNEDLVNAESFLNQSKESLESNPTNAKALALQSIEVSSKYASFDEPVPTESPEQAVEAANILFLKANESFNLGVQTIISDTFNLGSEMKFQKREIGPSLGESFFELGLQAAIVAIILVVLVVFLFFREIVPSLAVIAAAIFDIAGALALMAVFGIPLSLSTIPALLMLIGYSVDTDLMLTSRLLKRREKTPSERADDSMITGLTMTFTTLAALVVMITLSYFSQLSVVFEISAVLLFGLFADIISTWLMNAPVLLYYIEKKKGVSQ